MRVMFAGLGLILVCSNAIKLTEDCYKLSDAASSDTLTDVLGQTDMNYNALGKAAMGAANGAKMGSTGCCHP